MTVLLRRGNVTATYSEGVLAVKIAKYLLLIPLTLVTVVLGMSYKKTHSQPYDQSISEAMIPKFSAVTLDFVHQHDGTALPMLAACIIDIDGDGIPEVFLGGGKNQPDALFRFENGGFHAIAEIGGISKTTPDASYVELATRRADRLDRCRVSLRARHRPLGLLLP